MIRVPTLFAFGMFAVLVLAAGCKKKADPGPGGDGPPGPTTPGQLPAPFPTGEAEVAAKEETTKRLRQIGRALHAYHDAHGPFPAGIFGPNSDLGLSWRVQILPFLGEEEAKLFKEFRVNEPWDSEHNKKLVARMPEVFASAGKPADPGTTYFQSFFGPKVFLRPVIESRGGRPGVAPKVAPGTLHRGRRFTDITDGTSNTLMVVEGENSVEWSKPDDLAFEPFGRGTPPVPPLGGAFKNGFHGLMCDGAVKFFPKSLEEKTVAAMLSINGGEVLPQEARDILFPPKKGNSPPK